MAPDLTTSQLTNISFNSQAAVEWEIRRHEQVHWFWGLRAAEVAIDDKQKALVINQHLHRQYLREVEQKRRQVTALQFKQNLQKLSLDEIVLLAGLEDDIALAVFQQERLKPLIRDCQMELTTAQAEKDRILAEHPEVLQISYSMLQTKTREALIAKDSYFVASRVWAAHHQLPESVAEVLFSRNAVERERILNQEMQLRAQVNGGSLALQQAFHILNEMPSNDQEQLLLLMQGMLQLSSSNRQAALQKIARDLRLSLDQTALPEANCA